MIWKNPDSCETVWKMGNDPKKSGWFWHRLENGKWSGKIRTLLTLSGEREMIWKNMDSCETVQKMGNDLEKLEQLWNCLENGKWSGKIRIVVKQYGKWEMISKNMDSFETIRTMGNDLERSGQFMRFSLIREKTFRTRKNSATLLCFYPQCMSGIGWWRGGGSLQHKQVGKLEIEAVGAE